MWIYTASAEAFATQHDIRLAQNDRSKIVRIHLAKELDVLGFAATHDQEFIQQYQHDDQTFVASLQRLDEDLRRLNAHDNVITTTGELQLYRKWEKNVALPILQQRNIPIGQVLRIRDEQFSHELLAEDAKIQQYLNNLAMQSEAQRQALLRQILLASAALVTSGIALVFLVLTIHERNERKRYTLSRQIEEEQRVTAMLQRSLAPNILPHIAGVSLHVVYAPAALEHLVGGDWYEAVELSNNRLMCIIGDVAGHGLDAAVIMNRARQSILAASATETDPACILARTNDLLIQFQSVMVTAVCCIIDPAARCITYASAGHPPPLIVDSSNGALFLDNGGPPLGLFPGLILETQTASIKHGSCIFLYTDGLLEETHDILLGEKHILDSAIDSAKSDDPAHALYRNVIQGVRPKDDVAVLAIRVSEQYQV